MTSFVRSKPPDLIDGVVKRLRNDCSFPRENLAKGRVCLPRYVLCDALQGGHRMLNCPSYVRFGPTRDVFQSFLEFVGYFLIRFKNFVGLTYDRLKRLVAPSLNQPVFQLPADAQFSKGGIDLLTEDRDFKTVVV
jgi:hypothetical protein